MSSNQLLPVFVASGIAVLGCAAAFYFSDSETSSKRRKTYPIHTKDFDDELDRYDDDYPEIRPQRKIKRKIQEDDDEDEEDEEDEDDDEDDEDEEEEEGDDDDDDDDDDEDERVKYLVSKKQPRAKSKKGSRRA